MVQSDKFLRSGIGYYRFDWSRNGYRCSFGALILGVSRNPSKQSDLFTYAILGFAFRGYRRSRFYTSIAALQPQKENNLLNPNFVTGFADGESSFIILILKEPNNKTG
jgi:hypothetical protein